jgi:predicted signal transduction protein with EAL and GGDEF domain
VTLGHSLRMGVIAEGIEYADQVTRLREIGVESGQGFFFSPPVEAASIPALLSAEGQPLGTPRPARRPAREPKTALFPLGGFQLHPLGTERQH